MARLNSKPQRIFTKEGGVAKQISFDLQLKRSVMACMLWEKSFYENGEDIAERISSLCEKVNSETIAEYARDARNKQKLRHVPLLLITELAKKKYHNLASVIYDVVQRADELSELLAIYWREGKIPISAQIKKGLARAFTKFNEYQLAKYNRDQKIKLRDVLFLCHAKPIDEKQAEVWKRLVDNSLLIPDTWEVALSSGADKKETWKRLIAEKKLGALAFLRNLRNMQQSGVSVDIVRQGLTTLNIERVLPFRFIAAARYAPSLESELETLMFSCLKEHKKLKGTTTLLVDVSGSMDAPISQKSDLQRIDAACGLAMLLREICEHVNIFTFSEDLMEVPNRHGFALGEAIVRSQRHGGTYLGSSLQEIKNREIKNDRLIVITDEQSHDDIPDIKGKGYMINVASERNGVGYYSWIHIDGWSESIIDYILEFEEDLEKSYGE